MSPSDYISSWPGSYLIGLKLFNGEIQADLIPIVAYKIEKRLPKTKELLFPVVLFGGAVTEPISFWLGHDGLVRWQTAPQSLGTLEEWLAEINQCDLDFKKSYIETHKIGDIWAW